MGNHRVERIGKQQGNLSVYQWPFGRRFRVCLDLGDEKAVLTPAAARELAQDLLLHADEVEEYGDRETATWETPI